MTSEHDDDMAAEVGEGAAGETDTYAVVSEDLEERDADAAETDRLKTMQEDLHKSEGDEVE